MARRTQPSEVAGEHYDVVVVGNGAAGASVVQSLHESCPTQPAAPVLGGSEVDGGNHRHRPMRALVIGGAGFIGSHLVDSLVLSGHEVTVYDSLDPQVHGADSTYAPSPGVRFIRADIVDGAALAAAVEDADVVVHLAARVGVGQSVYEVASYVRTNSLGTANLLQAILARRPRRPRFPRLVVASSMSVYGEGSYTCGTHGYIFPPSRVVPVSGWDPPCPLCGAALEPVATAEDRPLNPASPYAITKFDTEALCLAVGRACDLGVVALRFFNTYGPRQSLSNPYTGVTSNFARRYLNGLAPEIYEDGRQMRDFVHVSDVVKAITLAMESDAAVGRAINVGTGTPTSVREVAVALGRAIVARGLAIGPDLAEPTILGLHRSGDIRHCWADTAVSRDLLGYVPSVTLADGLADLVSWVSTHEHVVDTDAARGELQGHGLER